MDVRELLKSLGAYRIYTAVTQVAVRGIAVDSAAVLDGSVFVAIRGVQRDGHDFIAEAAARKAAAIVFQEPGPGGRGIPAKLFKQWPGVCFVGVPDSRSAAARLAAKFNGYPAKQMHVCGITGTNGKTTLTYLIEALVARAGYRPGVIGTVNYRFGGTVLDSKNTTPGPVVLQSLIRRMREDGVQYLAMEVSSHALEQKRCEGIVFSSAIFTNLTRDHLDYHRTMQAYFRAKASLFRSLPSQAAAVINADDAFGAKLCRMTRAKVTTYGLQKSADVRAEIVSMRINATECIVHAGKHRYRLRLRLIGRHNLYNCLAVFAWGLSLGFKPRVIVETLESAAQPPGRLERVEGGKGISVFVDYAHTEDALRNVLCTLRQVARGRIITVFGCGGERDAGKRPLMGKAAGELSDYTIITNDNPRREDPQKIISAIVSGVTTTAFCVVPDRSKAIAKAVKSAGPGDVVLVAGKGHEDYQILGSKTVHFDDRQEVRRCLQLKK